MLNKHETTRKRIGGYSEIIDYWLELRQVLLVEYSTLAGLKNTNKNSLPTEEELNRFCQVLVDYISAGHFRIYNMIMERWKATGFSTNGEIDALYHGIVETTNPLLTFNDKYCAFVINEDNFAYFDQDISRVGEIMALRFEKEDLLIQVILGSLAIPPGA